MADPRKLRKLARWYREVAERAGNPAIWPARLMTAEGLEREANRLEKFAAPGPKQVVQRGPLRKTGDHRESTI